MEEEGGKKKEKRKNNPSHRNPSLQNPMPILAKRETHLISSLCESLPNLQSSILVQPIFQVFHRTHSDHERRGEDQPVVLFEHCSSESLCSRWVVDFPPWGFLWSPSRSRYRYFWWRSWAVWGCLKTAMAVWEREGLIEREPLSLFFSPNFDEMKYRTIEWS